MSGPRRSVLPIDFRRRLFRLVDPSTQLRLPLYVLVLAIGFGSLLTANGYIAYVRIYEATIATASPDIEYLIAEQTENFTRTSIAIGIAYLLTTLTVCVAYLYRIIGTSVPLRRHVVTLIEGDYTSRVQLRSSDSMAAGLAEDLNELARQLELNPPKRER